MNRYLITKTALAFFLIVVIIAVGLTVLIDVRNKKAKAPNSSIWLGVETIELNSTIMKKYNIHFSKGLLVSRVFLGSPAEIAGIKQGDIIRRWNGTSVTSQRQFQALLWNSSMGQKIKLSIYRQGGSILIYVKLGARPGAF